MTALSCATKTLAILAAVLNTATGVFIVLAISRHSIVLIIALLACIFHCLTCFVNISSLFLSKHRLHNYQKLCLVLVSLIPLALTGTALVMTTLDPQDLIIGERFCHDRMTCTWQGNKSLVIGYMLWFGTGLVQTGYLTLSMTNTPRTSHVSTTPSAQSTPVHLDEPSIPVQQKAFRYPLMRQTTDEAPFSYEVALAKAEMPPPRQQEIEIAITQQTSFVQSHAISSRSWASTLPTIVNSASPGSLQSKRKHYNSDGEIVSRHGSPEKNDWQGWGLALSSPSHKSRHQNTSLSNTYSSTSSTRSRPSKKLTNLHFHLPKSPVTGLDIQSKPEMDEIVLQNPPVTPSRITEPTENGRRGDLLGISKSTTIAERRSTPRRRKQGSLQISNLLNATPHRLSISVVSDSSSHASRQNSPGRKRSSIFGSLKPRLPESVPTSPTRHSLSRTNSPGKSTFKSPARSSFLKLYEDTAFNEWDTSKVESDPSYLVSMTDSRDLSGSHPPRQPSIGSIHSHSTGKSTDQASVWAGRSVRVSSDGSVVARVSPEGVKKLSQL